MKKNFNLVTLVVVMMVVLTACGNKTEQSNGTPTGSISTNKNNSANADNTITNTIKEPDTEPGEEITNNPEAEPTDKGEPVLTPDVDTDISVTPSDIKENPVVVTPSIPEPTRMPGATATSTPTKRVDNPGNNTSVPTQTPVLSKIPTATPTPTKVPTKVPTPTKVPVATSTPTPTPTPHIVSYILVVDKKVSTIESRDKTIAMYYFEHDTAPDYPYITSHTSWTAEQVKIAVANYTWETIFIDACRDIGETYHYIDDFVIGTEEITVDVDYVDLEGGYYGILGSDGWIHCYDIKDTKGCIYSDGRVERY